jgi:hypothetical protein
MFVLPVERILVTFVLQALVRRVRATVPGKLKFHPRASEVDAAER